MKLDETLEMMKDLTDARGIPGNERKHGRYEKTYRTVRRRNRS